MPAEEAEGWVLAGGQSRRMGLDKAALVLDAAPLLERMLAKLAALGLPAHVAGASAGSGSSQRGLADEQAGCGPISGLQTALRHSRAPLVLLLGVDLPLISTVVLSGLLARAHMTGALATIPRALGRPQPLCAVYRRELCDPLTEQLHAGTWKMMQAIQQAVLQACGRMDVFDIECVAAAGSICLERPAAWEFLNCNTPAEARLAERLLASWDTHAPPATTGGPIL